MTYERYSKTNLVFRNTITPWHENTFTENIESNTEKHLESERDWLHLFCNSFFPHFSLFEVRHTKHTKGRLAHSQKHEKSPQHCYWMQWYFRHKQLSNGIQNSMKENLWRLKRYGNCLRVSMATLTRNWCSQIVELLHSQNGEKLWAERQVRISILNNNGSCDQCNIYSSISCKPQINIMALKCGFKGEMGQERHLPYTFFVFSVTF